MKTTVNAIGKHLLIEFRNASNLTDHVAALNVFKQAVSDAGATLLDINLHSFKSEGMTEAGFTGVAILAESHMSIHTWPEKGYAALDIFMCGDAEPTLALPALRAHFQPGSEDVITVQRTPDSIQIPSIIN
ncbi:MAG: adenosylmethionine decarboxylase [Gammaproteobacteria bacterium TMED95]|nr:MAG: adenosylmethionine decarboxylase [Gammaproteobacteria bacterium TMED95]|tara:strand:- start:14311 stop:14703 length:393 start_codon:yes stop_codon:yes gene_type:complete